MATFVITIVKQYTADLWTKAKILTTTSCKLDAFLGINRIIQIILTDHSVPFKFTMALNK